MRFKVENMEVIKINTQISTLDSQELIYRRRVKRLLITKGVSRGEQIDRVNTFSIEKKHLKSFPHPKSVIAPTT
jgi:hypothetical protein